MWSSKSKVPILFENQAHLWKVAVSNVKNEIAVFWNLLSEAEKVRADKFVFEIDRNMFIAGRGVLRKLLGDYLQVEPSGIDFTYNEFGKPMLASEDDLSFNISHSHGVIALGFTKNNKIGVDVEYNKRPIEIEDIAHRFFSESECKSLQTLNKEIQLDAFYNCWTRKEALIKALGGGLSIPLNQFEVSLVPGHKPCLKNMNWDQDDVKNWNMEAFDCGEEYTAAIIVNQEEMEYFFYDFQVLKELRLD